MSKPYDILIKYPSRGRPERFFDCLNTIYNNFLDHDHFHVAATFDDDDPAMNNEQVRELVRKFKNISVTWGTSKNKIHAINRNLPDYGDIIMVMSDDVRVTFYGFDQFLRDCFSDNLDRLMHIPDNDEKDKLPILYVAGRPYMERFGWIYNPVYQCLFCDTESMEVAQILGRYKYVDSHGMIFHALPAYGHQKPDQLWLDQQEIGWSVDHKTYLERKARNFDL